MGETLDRVRAARARLAGAADAPAKTETPAPGLPQVVWRGRETEPEALTFAQAVDYVAAFGALPGPLGVDVEHTGYPVGHEHYRLKTIQLGNATAAVVLDAADDAQVMLAVYALDAATGITAHSATADLIPIALRAGLSSERWWHKVDDTMVLTSLTDPGQRPRGHDGTGALGLKDLAGALVEAPVAPAADAERKRHFAAHKWLTQTKTDTPLHRNGWAQVDPASPVMVTYAASDVLDTDALRSVLVPRLPDAPGLLERERAVQRITARLTERGLPLDAQRTRDTHAAVLAARQGPADELAGHGITDPAKTAQVSAVLVALGADLPQTKTGRPSTAKDAVDKLADDQGPVGDVARLLLGWRSQDKLRSTYTEGWVDALDRGDGRVRPTILTLGADATGRMSSVRPNVQQIPSAGGLRECIVAEPGHLLISADFSSVEVRIAAWVSDDQHLADMIARGVDLHAVVAEIVWGPGFTKANRYQAKRGVFGRLYGAGLATVARQVGGGPAVAQSVVDALDEAAPGLAAWSRGLNQAVRVGAAPYWKHASGRLTWFPSDSPHKAVNYAIQSSGREILVDSLLRWEAIHPGCVVIPVHDELVIQVPEADAQAWATDLERCMTHELTTASGTRIPIVAESDPPSPCWLSAT